MKRNLIHVVAILSLINLFTSSAVADVYRWTDEQGSVHFSDQPPLKQPSETVELPEITTYKSVSISDAPEEVDSGQNADKASANKKRVIMYSAEWCGVCKKAKSYFQKNKIPYIELDIDKSKQARKAFDKLNARGVPVILIGKTWMNGFNAQKFERIYY